MTNREEAKQWLLKPRINALQGILMGFYLATFIITNAKWFDDVFMMVIQGIMYIGYLITIMIFGREMGSATDLLINLRDIYNSDKWELDEKYYRTVQVINTGCSQLGIMFEQFNKKQGTDPKRSS